MRLYYLPIEPLSERYTEQWYRWFPEEFAKFFDEVRVIEGVPLLDHVKTGTFLDINSTIHYKAVQMANLSQRFFSGEVDYNDRFFVADVEYWGIEALRYLAVLNKCYGVKIYGFLHAASYTTGDFMEEMQDYGSVQCEESWFGIFDKIFVGSKYHRDKLLRNRLLYNPDRVIVTGNPYRSQDLQPVFERVRKSKQPFIICTNRPDPEKGIGNTLEQFVQLKYQHPDWRFAFTTSRKEWNAGGYLRERARRQGIEIHEGLTKEQYFSLLREAWVFTGNTHEENFGYCILEAMLMNTIPIIENNFSHPELVDYDQRCLFSAKNPQIDLIERAVKEPFEVRKYGLPYDRTLGNIAFECSR